MSAQELVLQSPETSAAPPEVAQRKKPREYSQTRGAIKSRRRRGNMDPETKKKMRERRRERDAIDRELKVTKNQEGFEDLSEDEQQKQLAEVEARVKQKL